MSAEQSKEVSPRCFQKGYCMIDQLITASQTTPVAKPVPASTVEDEEDSVFTGGKTLARYSTQLETEFRPAHQETLVREAWSDRPQAKRLMKRLETGE